MLNTSQCIRKRLLQHFGEEYVLSKDDKFIFSLFITLKKEAKARALSMEKIKTIMIKNIRWIIYKMSRMKLKKIKIRKLTIKQSSTNAT